jgi:hypothetical protein
LHSESTATNDEQRLNEAAYNELHSVTCKDYKNATHCDDENGEQCVNQLSLLSLLPLRFRDRKIFFLGGSLSAADAAGAAAASAAAAVARSFSAC